jgi:hypothetical protein
MQLLISNGMKNVITNSKGNILPMKIELFLSGSYALCHRSLSQKLYFCLLKKKRLFEK